MEKNKLYNLSKSEIDLINFVAKQRQDHKEKTGWDGLKTKSKKPRLELNKMGFGAEFIFCREMNLMPDFKVYNKSKENGSDEYDANYRGFSIDVKCTSKHYPLMVSPDLRSDCNIFAFFRSALNTTSIIVKFLLSNFSKTKSSLIKKFETKNLIC